MKKYNKHLAKTGVTVAAASVVLAGAVLSYNGTIAFGNEAAPLVGATASGPVVGNTASGPVVGNTASGSYTGGGSVSVPVYNGSALENVGTSTVSPTEKATVKTTDGSVTIDFPAGSFSSATEVKVGLAKESNLTVPKPTGTQVVGPIFTITAGDKEHIKLGQPVTITVKYDAEKLANINLRRMAVFYQDEVSGEWLYMGATVNSKDGTISFTTDHFSTYAVLANTRDFTDAANVTWAADAIQTALGGNIIEGFEDNTFKPNDTVTRAQFVQLLVRSLGLSSTDKASSLSFQDVKAGTWYYNSVAVAVKAGLIEGLSDSEFAPNATVTREQAATLINRAYTLKTTGTTASFKDSADVSAWAEKAIANLSAAGVLSGFEDNTVKPAAEVTRAQAVQLLVGSLQNVGKANVQ